MNYINPFKILYKMKKENYFVLLLIFTLLNIKPLFSQVYVDGNGKVGIGNISNPTSILNIEGTNYNSLFNYGANEDTYIRPGKSSGNLIFDYGNVGIGRTNPSYKLDVKGNLRFAVYDDDDEEWKYAITDNNGSDFCFKPYDNFGGDLGSSSLKWEDVYSYKVHYMVLYNYSDSTFKENIKPLSNNLEVVSHLNPVQIDYKSTIFSNISPDEKQNLIEENRNRVGFIAQEVQKTLPDLVSYDKEAEALKLNMIDIIPYLVGAIKDQQNIIQNRDIQIQSLENRLIAIEKQLTELNEIVNDDLKKSVAIYSELNKDVPELFQNRPNPFSESTTINYYLPDKISNASVFIYDLHGKQLRTWKLLQTGYGSIEIKAHELDAGIYYYALITDGKKEVNTYKMILTSE